MTIHDPIHARIQSFVTELEAMVRAAAIDAVAQSLGGAAPRSAPAVRRASSPVAASPTRTAAPARAKAKSGVKRDPKIIAALVERLGAYVKQHPGQGVEAIAAGMKVTTHELTLPVAKLLASKTIKKKGQKRATKYFPA